MTDAPRIADDARDRAAMRWIGVEGANSCPGLSAGARRVLIALINSMDANSLACFPSELRLAALLDMSLRSIKGAKDELREFGLISWITHGGPRHLCRYTINWDGLQKLADLGKKRAERAAQKRVYAKNRRSKTPNGATGFTIKGASDCTIKGATGCTIDEAQGAVCGTQGATGFTCMVQPASPELSQYPPSLTSQPPVGACALTGAAPPVSQNVSQTEKAEPEGALEGQAARSPRIRHYPCLWEAFEDDTEALDRLEDIHPDQIGKASAALALHGRDKARIIIMGMNS